uniref:DNA topoisomerase 2 n=1 Tax=Marseillevirus LCMAC202 TaxID=2506606 RepID=A0A481YYI6_9VIRU|nr:MAG: DNA topoisomerase II [Marseillevirus LCMAC202]
MPAKYTHLSQRNQILKRPGQHIGSIKNATRTVWIAQTEYEDDAEIERIVEQEIKYNPGLMHIFKEVLDNAQDNYFKSKESETPLHKIDVTVDQETGLVSIWNDGLWIPTTFHKWTKEEEIIDNKDHYEAEIIFGHLNSSSNYDDKDQKRVGGGLHGVGVKLTNIFSSEFKVEAFDPDTGLKFQQVYTENMSKSGKPKVTKLKQKKGYSRISYTADFTRFGVNGYTDEHLTVMKKYCMDCAMVTGQKVFFNGERIPIKNIAQYVSCYTDSNRLEFKSADSLVILCEKPAYEAGLAVISFVNGISTSKGGVHVDEWKKAIFKPLLEKIKTKYSAKGKNSTPLRITMKNLEQYFMIFINCNMINPDYEGQTKGVLSSPTPETKVPASKITALMKWDFIEDIEETVRIQGMKELKKTDGKKATSVNVPKADDANNAGSAKSSECTLFITEGDSAKTFAVKGISAIENGTDWFGVLPVRGKVLNVRGASAKQINDNKELTQLKAMLGLKHGVDYSDDDAFRTLRYGKIRILTDADPDGDHIKGLVINFFQYFYPSLIGRDYVSSLRTPILKAKLGKKLVTFYYLKTYKEWSKKQTKPFTAKYYKGLGTSTDEEIFEIFADPRYVQYIEDSKTADTVAMIFEKKRADDRKKWLENYEENEFVYNKKDGEEQVPVSEFFNNEMIGFSIYDNQRSIPSVVDGFKPSQRKAMWVGLKVLNQSKDYKVAQFAAEVAKQAEYHHGEISMEKAIIGMAQTFVGSNNIALLYESGQFGTRLQGGSDAAASRYIFTHLASITRFVLRKEDDPILEYLDDEGTQIEPKYFVPVIPILLVNGCTGIGTGYSSDVPAFNPLDLVEWIRVWLENSNTVDSGYPELKPWYWGFKGWTERDEKNKKRFLHYGEVQDLGKNCYQITELPVGVWTQDYKEHLNALKSGVSTGKTSKSGYEAMNVAQLKEELSNRDLPVSGAKKVLVERLKKYDKENGTSTKKTGNSGQLVSKWECHGDAYNVNLKVWTTPGVSIDYDNTKFKLCAYESLTNMTAFTPKGGIKKYDTLDDILRTFCQVRFKYYLKRKKHLLIVLKDKLCELEAKSQFISEALDNFNILKQTEDQLFDYLEEQEYWKKDGSYKYLTDMPVRTFTTDKYSELLEKIKEVQREIEYVKKKTPKQMWTRELDEFVKAYKKWKTDMETIHAKLSKKKIKRKRAGRSFKN